MGIISQDRLLAAGDSMRVLDKLFGSTMSTLPISIAYGDGPPAFTNADGIWLSEDVVVHDAENACVYLAHEIMHHVVSEPAVNNAFDPHTVNIGEDYVINYKLKKLYGLDVRKVKYKGIYDARIGRKPLFEACSTVSGSRGQSVSPCGCRGVPHPNILALAMRIKRSLNLGHVEDVVYLDADDDKVFLNALGNSFKDLIKSSTLPLDTRYLLRNLWGAAYLSTPVATPIKAMTAEHAATFGWDNGAIRDVTIGDPEFALIAAARYINNLAMHEAFLRSSLSYCKTRIYRYEDEIARLRRRRGTKQKLGKLTSRIAKAEINRDYLNRKLSESRIVHNMLQDTRYLRTTSIVYKPIVSLKPATEINHSGLPLLAASELRADLRKLSHAQINPDKLRRLKALEEALTQALSGAGGNPDQGQDADPSEGTTDSSTTGSGTDDTDGQETEKGDSDVDDESVVPEVNLGSLKAGASNPTRLDNLNAAFGSMTTLEEILVRMHHYDTQLTSRRSPVPDETRQATDTTYTFGNDLNKVDASELVLLNATPETRLLFLSRLANSELLLTVPQQSKRQPVIMMVDASGSMSGAPYAIAAGFALSLAKKLHADNRGFALLVFSSTVSNAVVLGEASYSQLLQTLLTPQMSGTNFDLAIRTALVLRERLEWKDTSFIMVTDGGDQITKGTEEMWDEKTVAKDSFVAVLVRGSDRGLMGLPTETVSVRNKTGLLNTLERIGDSVL